MTPQKTHSLVKSGHNALHSKAKILHCDICPDNFMVDPKDPSRGVLIDFNNAIREGEGIDRVGYLSVGQKCMALELLAAENRPLHTYEHDLQSFLWAFWDIVLNYCRGVRVLRPDPHNNTAWGRSTLQVNKVEKIGFLRLLDEQQTESIPIFCEELGSKDNGLNDFIFRWSASIDDNKPMGYNDVVAGLEQVISGFP